MIGSLTLSVMRQTLSRDNRACNDFTNAGQSLELASCLDEIVSQRSHIDASETPTMKFEASQRDPHTNILSRVHRVVPSIEISQRALRSILLDELALQNGLDSITIKRAVFAPNFGVQAFLDVYKPDRRSFAKFEAKGARQVKTENRLTQKRITEELSFGGRLGFYAQAKLRKEFSILLDLNPSEAWRNTFTPTERLLELRGKVESAIGCKPSCCFRTSRGAVMTWILRNPISQAGASRMVTQFIETRLQSLSADDFLLVQIRPKDSSNSQSALLVPDPTCLIHCQTFLPDEFLTSALPLCDFTFPTKVPDLDNTLDDKSPIISEEDLQYAERVAQAFPGSEEERRGLLGFMCHLIEFYQQPHLEDRCRVRRHDGWLSLPGTLMERWFDGHRKILPWLLETQILQRDNGYSSGSDCRPSQARCYRFEKRSAPADPRIVFFAQNAKELIKMSKDADSKLALGPSALYKYKKNPESIPYRTFKKLETALRNSQRRL